MPNGSERYGWFDTIYDTVFPVTFATRAENTAAHRRWDMLIRFCTDLSHPRIPVRVNYDDRWDDDELEEPSMFQPWDATYCPTCAVLIGPLEYEGQQGGASADPIWWADTYAAHAWVG